MLSGNFPQCSRLASSAQQWISLTLVDICNTEMAPVDDVGDIPAQTPMTWAVHSAPRCWKSWLLVAHRLPSWRTDTHLMPEMAGRWEIIPLPCWGLLLAELTWEYKISASCPELGQLLGAVHTPKALVRIRLKLKSSLTLCLFLPPALSGFPPFLTGFSQEH